MANGETALWNAAAEPNINIGRAALEELVLHTARAVIKTLNHAIPNHAAQL